MSTFDASQDQFNQYHFTVVEMDLPIVTGAASLTTAIELAEPQWYWKLNEETGIVATDTMLNGNLEYESAASTAGYNIIPSSADGLGSAKNIKGNTAWQIYDPIPPVVAPVDYVARWELESTADDSSGNAHNGTIVSAPTFGTGQIGNALTFDGVNDRIDITNSAALQPTIMTACAWVKTTSTSEQQIFQNRRLVASVLSGFDLSINPSDGRVQAKIYRNTGTSSEHYRWATGNTFNIANNGNWHHVAMTYDNVNLKLYLDGVLDFTLAGVGYLAYNATTYPVIGSGTSTGSSFFYPFNGSIDDVRLYNRALSSAEMLSIYTTGGGI